MLLSGKITLGVLFGPIGSGRLVLLLCLGSELGRIRLRPEVGSGGAGLREEAREDGLDEGSEQDLGAGSLRKSHPEDENEFEGIIECYKQSAGTRGTSKWDWHTEPVDRIDHALDDGQERIDDPVLKKGCGSVNSSDSHEKCPSAYRQPLAKS